MKEALLNGRSIETYPSGRFPALFIDDNPEEVALIENSLRENLTAVEEAEAVGRLATELNYTQVQLSKILGKKPQTISDILSLNRHR